MAKTEVLDPEAADELFEPRARLAYWRICRAGRKGPSGAAKGWSAWTSYRAALEFRADPNSGDEDDLQDLARLDDARAGGRL